MDNVQSDILVSVITPVFNASETVRRAVESVAAQGVCEIEHLLINDGSTDNSLELLIQMEEEYPHIKIIDQVNQGAGPARNQGIRAARGRYVAFLDADDVWLPGKLERQIAFMEEAGCYFSYGDYSVFDISANKIVTRYKLPDQLSYQQLLAGCPIGCLTVAYNREALGRVEMPDVRRGQDWALWLKVTRGGMIAKKYPGDLAIYYVGQASLSANKLKKMRDVFRIYREEEKLGLFSSLRYLFLHIMYVLRK